MSKSTYEELESTIKELRRMAFSARRNSHNCGPFQYSDLCEEIIDITELVKGVSPMTALNKQAGAGDVNPKTYYIHPAAFGSTKDHGYGHVPVVKADDFENLRAKLEAAEKRIAELEARTPYGYLRQCDGQIQISIGSERPHDRSGGYATPWFAIYTAAGIGVNVELQGGKCE